MFTIDNIFIKLLFRKMVVAITLNGYRVVSYTNAMLKNQAIVYLKMKFIFQIYELMNNLLTYKSFIATSFFGVEVFFFCSKGVF